MSEDLGIIAARAMHDTWHLPSNESWNAVAQAVIKAHEARRWKPIATAPIGSPVLVGVWKNGKWLQCLCVGCTADFGWTHWTELPAPPKEGE